MKKNLLVMAIMSIMCLASATTAHAEFIVAPTAEEADGTTAGYVWYMEEQQRWIDRLVNANADRINQIYDPVEKLHEVVKAVGTYADTLDRSQAWTELEQFRAGKLGAETMSFYVIKLSEAVGLNTEYVHGIYTDVNYGLSMNVCTINGVTYYADAYNYSVRKDDSLLGTTTQPDYFITVAQSLAMPSESGYKKGDVLYNADGSIGATFV